MTTPAPRTATSTDRSTRRAEIIVCGLTSLDAALTDHDPEIVVSLIGAGEVRRLSTPRRQHLHLVCSDIEEDRGPYRAPGPQHVQGLLDVVDGWSRTRPLLIHCYAGRSRSWAAAFTAACQVSADTEDAIAKGILALAPWARPHQGFVGLADAILGRDGHMKTAMQLMHGTTHSSRQSDRPHAPVVLRLARV